MSTTVLTALFWGIWHLVTGSVPVVTNLQLTPDTAYELPFAVSRWFDVLFAGVWTALVVLVVTSESLRSNEDVGAGLVVGLVFGLGAGLVVGLGAGLVVGLVFGLGAGLVVGLGAGLVVGLVVGLKYLFRKKTWYSIRDWYLAR